MEFPLGVLWLPMTLNIAAIVHRTYRAISCSAVQRMVVLSWTSSLAADLRLLEAKLLGRSIIGVDVSPTALERCREKTNFEYQNSGQVAIHRGDALNLDFLQARSVDPICTHRPYADIIHYSKDIPDDLSLFGANEFWNR